MTLTWDGIRPRLTGRFEQGRPVDAFTWWHANGKKRASYAFSAAAPAGTWETWYPNGQPQWQVRFQDGVPHGSVREARDDGTKRFEGHFTAGQRSGEWTAWYRSGTRAGEGHYAEDRPAGRWAVWWKSGASAGVREGRGDWKYAAADGGVLSADRYEVARHPPSADPVGSPGDLVFGEGRPVDEGPPEFVPPLTVPDHSARDGVFPWGSLHGVWFDEFLIELRLPRDDLD